MRNLICGIILAASVAAAGPLSSPVTVEHKQRKADIAKAADPNASVTWAQVKADLDAVETALDAVDLSTVDPAAFTGAQKTCLQNLKKAVGDLKTAAKNLMQADRKMVKKLKAERDIEEAVK